MKLDRIYTRSGDDGRTSLGDGARLPKFHGRGVAYGTVDEANAIIGVALLHIAHTDVRDALIRIQVDLFDLGADLCRPERDTRKVEPDPGDRTTAFGVFFTSWLLDRSLILGAAITALSILLLCLGFRNVRVTGRALASVGLFYALFVGVLMMII